MKIEINDDSIIFTIERDNELKELKINLDKNINIPYEISLSPACLTINDQRAVSFK